MNKEKTKTTRVGEIFATGAFCAPLQRPNPETGKMEWVWIVTRFEDDSYMDGNYVEPEYRADTREELISEYSHTPEEKVLISGE